MTGFGASQLETERYSIKVEIRSLNGKFLDLACRLPKFLYSEELKLRNYLSQALSRGTITVNITIQDYENPAVNEINESIFKSYYLQLNKLSQDLNFDSSNIANSILNLPDVINSQEKEIHPEMLKDIYLSLEKAFLHFDEFRKTEGQSLSDLLQKYVEDIVKLLPLITPFEQERNTLLRERILKNISNLNDAELDKNRFEQELIYYLEKFDISEEKTRLQQHCEYFIDVLKNEPNGKKLGFICQEMGREINTLGSKANQSDIQKIVVEMKDILEKMKEQILNVL